MPRSIRLLTTAVMSALIALVSLAGCNLQDPGLDDVPDAGPADAVADDDADASTPECGGDELECDNTCVNPETDPDHCGACNNACDDVGNGVAVCETGSCGVECDNDDDVFCDEYNLCTDTTVDPSHCGECGNACDEEAICDGSGCVDCDPGLTGCDNQCVNLDIDTDHCGECGKGCDDGQTCFLGDCLDVPACDPNDAPFGGGDGASGTPYTICTVEHLLNLNDDSDQFDPDFLDDHFVLANDLDMEGVDFSPIGQADDDDDDLNGFSGTFDGLGFALHQLEVEGTDQVGLFGTVDTGEISRLVLEDAAVTGDEDVGAVAGVNQQGTIYGVGTTGTVHCQGNHCGAMVGFNDGTISTVLTATSVSGENQVGGLVGRAEEESTIDNVGGHGDVEGDSNVGGLAGNNLGDITDAETTGDVVGQFYAGGLAGSNSGEITNSSAYGDVISEWVAGGFVGYMEIESMISDATADGDVEIAASDSSLNSQAGGFVGLMGFGFVEGDPGIIIRGQAGGQVTGENQSGGFAGGIVDGEVYESFASGNVIGDNQIGGFAGRNDGDIADCYAIGDVDGDEQVGGLVGENINTVERTYSTGSVTGNSDVGGLIGDNDGSVDDSYWNIDSSTQDSSDGGTGRNDGEFDDEASFPGFDFNDIWQMGDDRPHLQWDQD